MEKDEFYMRRCIELAQKAIGETYPNPMVGAVIVYQDKIIGEGYHHFSGSSHAEINAICSVENQNLLSESTIYVSLEPCSHYGKTPPCALKLKEIGFKRIVVGVLDVNEKVQGKGIEILNKSGIELRVGVLQEECKELNKRFFTFHQKKRPYIILKWAESADRLMDKDFKSYAISNVLVNQYMHQMRSEEHAYLVGTTTALRDNPSLTTRGVLRRNPIRVLIDFELKVSVQHNLLNQESKTFIFNSIKNEVSGNLVYIKVSRENFIPQLLEKLHEQEIQSLVVEGGKYTLESFISLGLWDEAVVIRNENLILEHGTKAPGLDIERIKREKKRDNFIDYYKNV